MENFANENIFSYSHIVSSMVFPSDLHFDKQDLELDILHSVYGEDIPIAIDPIFIASRFNIDVVEKELNQDIESQIYFSKSTQKITIEHIKTSEFKKAFMVCQNLGHLFLHILKNKKMYFINKLSSKNNFQQHRISNNLSYKIQTQNTILMQEANIFAGKLLIPKDALLEVLNKAKKGERFLLSDICKVFNSPNDIMVETLKLYDLWDFSRIYDDL